MLSERLAELVIQFTLEGVDKLHTALGQVQQSLARVTEGAEKMGKVATYAFAALSAPLLGFIRQGMQLSIVSEQLRFQMERVALALSGLFRPEIQKVIELVRTV